jgi:hypothetical protein
MLLCAHWLAILIVTATGQDSALRVAPQNDVTQIEVIAQLPKKIADQLPAGMLSQEEGERLLHLCLVIDGKDGPAMLGNYRREGQTLAFTPRFPLQNGKSYRASLLQAGKPIDTIIYHVPARPAAPLAEVVAVWPANEVLPANHLRFYIQFSRPMRGGSDIFDQIHLQDADGQDVTDPWLRDELWSEDGTLLTLYIHPGRIKWGVLLRLLLGPALEPDRNYTLVVSRDMLDADSRKLAKEYRKKFRTTAEDRTRIEISTWKLESPNVGTRAPLRLAFPKALDSRGLERFLKVVDGNGKPLLGKIEVTKDGRSWSFVPDAVWTAQECKIVVDQQLEDVAGNTPLHPFDVDAEAPVPPPQRMSLPFRPRS